MIISRTPLRISFFGGGTDYPAWFREHPGAVLATTVDKYIYVTCRYLPPFFDHTLRLSYSRLEHVSAIDAIAHPTARECLRMMGLESNLEIHTDSDMPARTGLGSSSAFTVGLLHVLHAYKGELTTKQQLAAEATYVEQGLVHESVGCQDQILAAYGGLNRVEFSTESIGVRPMPLTASRREEFERHLMLFYSGISRNAPEIAAEQLEHLAENAATLERMYEMVDEGARLVSSSHGWKEFGDLLHQSWLLKRSLSRTVSTNAIDDVYAAARAAGAYGGKLLGAGGGGFLLIFADPDCQPAIRSALAGLLYVPVRLDSTGSQIIFYQPTHGPSGSRGA